MTILTVSFLGFGIRRRIYFHDFGKNIGGERVQGSSSLETNDLRISVRRSRVSTCTCPVAQGVPSYTLALTL